MTQQKEKDKNNGTGKGCFIALGVLAVAIVLVSRACGCGSAEQTPEEYPGTSSESEAVSFDLPTPEVDLNQEYIGRRFRTTRCVCGATHTSGVARFFQRGECPVSNDGYHHFN